MPEDGEGRSYRRLQYVGGYELFSPLAAGGMGTVFKAREMDTGRIVALKVLPPSAARNPGLVERFDHEAKIACSLSHPNIVEGIASGSVKNLHFYAMELVVGESIADMLSRKGRLATDQTVQILWDVAQGLFGAHEAGLIHRDVKPHNLMIDRDGVVKLCDLGLARAQKSREVTDATAPEGTPFYMSPEQVTCDGPIDARTDIYSLGATAYHMVTGEPPYKADTRGKVMKMHVTSELTPVRKRFPSADEHLAAVIEKCLSKAPDDRYQTMEELASDLHEIQDGNVPKAFTERRAKPKSRRVSSRRLASKPSVPSRASVSEAETKTDEEPVKQPQARPKRQSSRRVPPGKPAPAAAVPAKRPEPPPEPVKKEKPPREATPRPAKQKSRRISSRRPAPEITTRQKVTSIVVTGGVAVAVLAVVVGGLWWFVTRDEGDAAARPPDGREVASRKESTTADLTRAIEELTQKADGLAAKGDFVAALAVFDQYPSDFDEAARQICEIKRKTIRERAEDELARVLGDAEKAMGAGDLAGALAMLDEASGLRFADAAGGIERLRARVVEAREKAEEDRRRREAEAAAARRARMLAARARLSAVIAQFDVAMVKVGPHGGVRVVNGALADAAFAEQKPELMTLMLVAQEVARLQEAGAKALDHLAESRESVSLKLKTGESLTGTISSVRRSGRDLMFIMEVDVDGKRRTTVSYASKLEPAARTSLMLSGKPGSADERVARAIIALSWRDAAGARAMLEGAEGHLLHKHYESKLDKIAK